MTLCINLLISQMCTFHAVKAFEEYRLCWINALQHWFMCCKARVHQSLYYLLVQGLQVHYRQKHDVFKFMDWYLAA